jgi:hypothetical protein
VGHPVVHTIQLYCPNWSYKRWATWLKGELPLFYKTGKQPPTALFGACNPINVTIFNLNETGWKVEKKSDILIYKKETDPGTLLHFQLIMITHESSSYTPFIRRYEVSFPSQLQPKTCSSHLLSP